HVEWSIRALRAGKHVLCEKPLTRHPAEAEEVFDVAEREGRLVMEAFMWAHAPQIRRARELIDDGEIGELRLIRSTHAFDADAPRLELRKDGRAEEIPVETRDAYGAELDNLSAAIRGEAEPLLGRSDGVAQARVLAAVRRSAEQGTPVTP